MHKFSGPRDWADMRLFLAIAEHGSLSAAAHHLGLTQPSVGRRLTELEERFGTTLFVRTGRRMVLTDVGRSILNNAHAMEREMQAIERTVEVESTGLSGAVRITATEGIGSEWLAPELFPFSQQHPDIRLEIIVENRVVDLVNRDADIALRLNRPTEPELIGRKLVDLGLGLYASNAYLQRFPPLANREALFDSNDPKATHRFVTLSMQGAVTADDLAHGYLTEWLGRAPPQAPALVTNSPTAQLAAVRSGYGIGVLTHRWANMFPDLQRVLPDMEIGAMELWLVTHEDLRHSARIRAVADYLAERITAMRSLYEQGEGVPYDAFGTRQQDEI